MAGVPMRVSQHSGQGRINHGGHGGHNHGMMLPHQYSPGQGVIVTMGGGHMAPSHGPQSHMSGPQSHMSGPQNHMSAPQSHMNGPQNHLNGPQNHMNGPQNHMNGPQNHINGPQNHMNGPQNHMNGPQNHMSGHHNVHNSHIGGQTHHNHHGSVHHENYHHHPHHHTSVPPPTHYQPPPPPYTTLPLSQILPPPSSSNSMLVKEKTPMCLVNELARYNKVSHQYRLTDESGPAHKKNFTVCLKIGETEEYSASGPSIKKAQHAAAAISLEKTQFKHPSPKAKNMKNANITPTVELNALAMKRGEATSYLFLDTNNSNSSNSHRQNFNNGYNGRSNGGNGSITNNGQFSNNQRSGGYPQIFCVKLRVGSREFVGEGQTAQAAKHNAAGKALKLLKEVPIPDGQSKLDPTSQPFTPGIEYDELKSPISLVHEIALKRNLQVYFEVVREAGPPHMRTFITKCIVGDFLTEGEGNGKKVSKKRAAELMLDRLKQLPPVASAMVPKPRKVVPGKKKSRNLIKTEPKDGIPGVVPVMGMGQDSAQTINPISRLIQIQQAKKEKEPVYTLIAERGMPRRREFVMQVSVGQHSTTGTGPNKKLAKRAAAESLLQLLGYSRPSIQPNKSAIKTGSEADKLEKSKKLTFVDEVGSQLESLDIGHVIRADTQGSGGRQLAPGLLYLEDKKQNKTSIGPVNGKSLMTNGTGNTQAATIAKELLNGGVSPTADAIAKTTAKINNSSSKNSNIPVQPLPQLPTSGQGVSAKEQLAYLSQVLGFTVTYNDFPKKGEYLSLVSLSTNPPQVSHGAGSTLEGSHNNAALTALRTLANNGLDNINTDAGSMKKVSINS